MTTNERCNQDVTKPDESLAQAMPDPAGPPKPVEKEDDVLRALPGPGRGAGRRGRSPVAADGIHGGNLECDADRPRSSGGSAGPKSAAPWSRPISGPGE